MVREIPLSNMPLAALVDDDDAELVLGLSWTGMRDHYTIYVRHFFRDRGQMRSFSMHRLLLKPGPREQVDHINGNGLDNRRLNLRIASPSQNSLNRRCQSLNTSGFRGVNRQRSGSNRWAWVARIGFENQRIYLGSYDSPEDAARAYDAEARKLFGDFARLNFPDEVSKAEHTA